MKIKQLFAIALLFAFTATTNSVFAQQEKGKEKKEQKAVAKATKETDKAQKAGDEAQKQYTFVIFVLF